MTHTCNPSNAEGWGGITNWRPVWATQGDSISTFRKKSRDVVQWSRAPGFNPQQQQQQNLYPTCKMYYIIILWGSWNIPISQMIFYVENKCLVYSEKNEQGEDKYLLQTISFRLWKAWLKTKIKPFLCSQFKIHKSLPEIRLIWSCWKAPGTLSGLERMTDLLLQGATPEWPQATPQPLPNKTFLICTLKIKIWN